MWPRPRSWREAGSSHVTPNEHHETRRLALQLLCTLDVQGVDAWPAIEPYLTEEPMPATVKERAATMARETFEKHDQWDEQISGVSQRWDVRRMGLVDRNILRLALNEMSRPDTTPVKVALDEAIELAKEFGAEESPAFVNGVLDAIWRRHTAPQRDAAPAHEQGGSETDPSSNRAAGATSNESTD
jgi:transcription antitermination protein NusB